MTATTPDGDERATAARLERDHPGWTVLWSPSRRAFWATARYCDPALWACTAEALSLAIADVEREHAARAGVVR